MSENKKEAVQDEMLAERFALSCERIAQILQEEAVDAAFRDYFVRTAGLIDLFVQEFHYVADGNLEKAGMEELREHNRRLYEDILPENYGKSYANPSFAAARLGKEFGQMLSFLAAELRSLIAFAYEQDVESMVIRMELFLEVYHAFVSAAEEGVSPRAEEIRDEMMAEARTEEVTDIEYLKKLYSFFLTSLYHMTKDDVDKVEEQAEKYGHSETRELAFLVAHSMLHLFGYDHMEEGEREQMEDRQRKILETRGYTR